MPGTATTEQMQLWADYVAFEQKQSAKASPARVQNLLERCALPVCPRRRSRRLIPRRLVARHFLTEGAWTLYLGFLDTHFRVPEIAGGRAWPGCAAGSDVVAPARGGGGGACADKTHLRAVRNCSWSSQLWSARVRFLERQQRPLDEVRPQPLPATAAAAHPHTLRRSGGAGRMHWRAP
jgi:hypothetical protein